jgi:hypothetical protein
MVKKPDNAVIERVKALYRSNELARRFFDLVASRSNDARFTTIDNIMRTFALTRGEAVALFREIADTGAAELYVGRRGWKTRLVWKFSCISVGQAASGEDVELEEVTNPDLEEEAEEAEEGSGIPTITAKITIQDAKHMLAQSLGLDPSNIEILIKA